MKKKHNHNAESRTLEIVENGKNAMNEWKQRWQMQMEFVSHLNVVTSLKLNYTII